MRPAWAEIDLGAIKENIRRIKGALDPKILLMAVVKANAYGHGMAPVARAAQEAGADRLGVALAEEAFALRGAGVSLPIQILSEAPLPVIEEIVKSDVISTVYSLKAAEATDKAAQALGRRAKVHLKVDTGMHRVGVRPEGAVSLYRSLAGMTGIEVEGFLTHFACADNPMDEYTKKQLDEFLRIKNEIGAPGIWHAANSAAALFYPAARLDMVRVGIAMYGLQPSADRTPPVPLTPALSLKAKVGFIQELAPGDGVSYGLTYKADRPLRAAVLPIGYGDGYTRLLSNRGSVLINGRRRPLIGNICMDQLLVELDDGVRPGDEAVLIGPQGEETISAEEIASVLGTINYEVVCMINNRIPRIYKDGATGPRGR